MIATLPSSVVDTLALGLHRVARATTSFNSTATTVTKEKLFADLESNRLTRGGVVPWTGVDINKQDGSAECVDIDAIYSKTPNGSATFVSNGDHSINLKNDSLNNPIYPKANFCPNMPNYSYSYLANETTTSQTDLNLRILRETDIISDSPPYYGSTFDIGHSSNVKYVMVDRASDDISDTLLPLTTSILDNLAYIKETDIILKETEIIRNLTDNCCLEYLRSSRTNAAGASSSVGLSSSDDSRAAGVIDAIQCMRRLAIETEKRLEKCEEASYANSFVSPRAEVEGIESERVNFEETLSRGNSSSSCQLATLGNEIDNLGFDCSEQAKLVPLNLIYEDDPCTTEDVLFTEDTADHCNKQPHQQEEGETSVLCTNVEETSSNTSRAKKGGLLKSRLKLLRNIGKCRRRKMLDIQTTVEECLEKSRETAMKISDAESDESAVSNDVIAGRAAEEVGIDDDTRSGGTRHERSPPTQFIQTLKNTKWNTRLLASLRWLSQRKKLLAVGHTSDRVLVESDSSTSFMNAIAPISSNDTAKDDTTATTPVVPLETSALLLQVSKDSREGNDKNIRSLGDSSSENIIAADIGSRYISKLPSSPRRDMAIENSRILCNNADLSQYVVTSQCVGASVGSTRDGDCYAVDVTNGDELQPTLMTEYDIDEGEDDDHGDDEKVTVPISLCLIILTAYVFAGSILFSSWEGWDYLTGSYFCFITLTTIGFGDFVPGMDADKWDSSGRLVLCALWLAFGLSLLAMCFNLMQEEVRDKCRWLGLKMGFIKKDSEQ